MTMLIHSNRYSIAELLGMLERRELVINKDYQRGSGLWPKGAQSYFIDTILEGYPFPKLYAHYVINRSERKPRRELVDGQQRLTTISRFVENKLVLSGDTRYKGYCFEDFDEEKQREFLAYAVSVDVIRMADQADILRMLRRMNAYTLPLNEAETRHSNFQGEFKWFVNNLCDDLNNFFVQYGVFTERQIVQMADADLLTDIVLAWERGISGTTAADLSGLYRKYDGKFEEGERIGKMIKDAVECIYTKFYVLRGSHLMRPYVLHSLIVALMHARFGIPAVAGQVSGDFGGRFCVDKKIAGSRLLELANVHEAGEDDGSYRRYVWGCNEDVNSADKRAARMLGIFDALGFKEVEVIDHDIAELPLGKS